MKQGEALRGACQDGEMAIENTRQIEDEICAALRGVGSICRKHFPLDFLMIKHRNWVVPNL